MKALALMLCLLLAPVTSVAQEPPSAAVQQSESGPEANPASVQTVTAPTSMSLEHLALPTPEWKIGGSAWCAQRNTNYCTYAWNKISFCCYPTYTAPGASCPLICI